MELRALIFLSSRYREEDDGSSSSTLFVHYIQKGCQFSCRLSEAMHEAGCLPWYLLRADSHWGRSVCTRDKGALFEVTHLKI